MDIVALGFMLFAFFLGAGNIIFPPMAGYLAGDFYISAMFGFLLTAVGLPLAGVIAIAIAGGSWQKLTDYLPQGISTAIAVLIFIIIGPAFAAPRTGLVAYEMAIKPFIIESSSQFNLTLFSVIFFAVAMFFSWSQGQLIDLIGKILTPVLFCGLVILAVGVFIDPQSEIMAAQGDYINQPFVKGFLEGYNTMDTFAALMFGMLIVDSLRSRGITQKAETKKYLISAAFIAAAGLAFVYISLFYLGATSGAIANSANNGGMILSQYIQALFGSSGQYILSTVALLACLTTAIGLISACSDYFSSLTPLNYKPWVIINGVACAIVANVGLNQLIELSVPVLFALYPVAIALVILTFIRNRLPDPQRAYRIVISVSFIFALIDAIKAAGGDASSFQFIPLVDVGMGWLLPLVLSIFLMFILPRKEVHSPA